jgi:hypothetical protein
MPWRFVPAALLVTGLIAGAPALTQQPSGNPPPADKPVQLEPVAETRLLMEGLNLPNFRGLDRLLRERPKDAEAWKFVRGQALLIAEAGNLLLLRPPRSKGRQTWFSRAAELRDAGRRLAESAAARDYARSRADLVSLANTCNRCHHSFRVKVEVTPFAEPSDGAKE